jgi:hypothetical protein
LPDTDNYSHRHGPEASVEAIAKADSCFAELVEAAGGMDAFLESHAVILLADHAQTAVHRGLPLADLLAAEWSVLQPSDDRPELAQLAVSPTGRAAHVYLLPCDGEQAVPAEVAARLGEIEGIDIVCRLEGGDGRPLRRESPGVPAGGDVWAVVERRGHRLRFRPGSGVVDLRGGGWEIDGEEEALEATVAAGAIVSDAYPDPLGRVWSALSAPHAGDFVLSLEPGFEAVDWGGVSHAGGGSHGSLHAGDSLGPLLFVGCGPESAAERAQWSLRDVAPAVLEHFGVPGNG